ncbi:MAG: pilus assembly protein PilM, partial [Candidatus Eisenbacteria bacterium]|nr:pilus assembly protein PilM [Candidatus Eisenbacteria bacterium]
EGRRALRLACLDQRAPLNGTGDRRSFARSLSSFLRAQGYRGKRAVVALPSPMFDMASLTVAAGSGDPMADVRAGVQTHLSYPVDEAVIDYMPLHSSSGGGAARQDVLVVAARRAVVESLLELLRLAGLHVVAVDVPPAALGRLTRLLRGDGNAGPTAVVDVGATQTTAVIAEADMLMCCRRNPLGGSHFTAAIQKALEVSEDEAEQIKRQYVVGMYTEDTADEETHRRVHTILRDVLRPTLEQFAAEFQRLLRYFSTRSKGRQVVQTLLVGGGSQMASLRIAVSEITQVPAITLGSPDQPEHPAFELHGCLPTLPVACFGVASGLALRGAP